MAKTKKKDNPVLALMQTGVEAYKKECVDGKVLVPSAALLMGDKNPAYVMPAKPSDEENYSLVQGALNACVIAARLCTEEGKPYFTTRDNKILIVNHMREKMSARTVLHVSYEIQYLSGEIGKKHFKQLMRQIGMDEEGTDLHEDDIYTDDETHAANEEANEEQEDLNDQSGYEKQGVDFDSAAPVPPNPTYTEEAESGVLKTPTVAQAEGNSEPHLL